MKKAKCREIIFKNEKTKASYSEGVSKRAYDIKENIDIVMSNIYAKRCVDDIVRTALAKGCEGLDTDIIDVESIERAGKDFVKCGNAFFEVVQYDGKVKSLYHVPAKTINFKRDKDIVSFYQNGDEETLFSKFDKTRIPRKGKYHSILHIMNYEDDAFVGVPAWIPAKLKIKQTSNADEYVDSFYEDDAIPAGVFSVIGAELSDEAFTKLENGLSNNTGARNRKTLSLLELPEGAKSEYTPFNDNIVDEPFLKLQHDSKIDVCIAFSVPPKRLGIETAGKLGGGNEYETQLEGYYNDVIVPLQEKFEQHLPIEGLKFNRPKIEKSQKLEKEDKVAKINQLLEEILDAD